MKTAVFLLLAAFFLVGISSAYSDYCNPPDNMTVDIDHNGNWYNFTITTDICYECHETSWFGDIECGVCPPPEATFTSNVTCAIVPGAIQFNDTSTNSPTSWYWDFGDGNTSTDQNPVHTYDFTGAFTVRFLATNGGGSNWRNISNYILIRPYGDTCEGIAPAGSSGISAVSRKEPVPLKTEIVGVPFLVIPLLCLYYIFRGKQDEDENPIWGDVLASGLGTIVSAVVVIWFIQGGITSVPVTLENSSYLVPSDMPMEDVRSLHESITGTIPVLGVRGSGMRMSSAISTAESFDNMTILIHTHDTVVQQYQDVGVALLYGLLCLILTVLFFFSAGHFVSQLEMREEDENDPENWR